MKLLVLSYSNRYVDDHVSVTNKRRYCDKHGIDFIHHTKAKHILTDRAHLGFQKQIYMLQYMSEYEWIFWIDDDALFMNSAIDLHDLVVRYQEYDMILPLEINSINNGVQLVRTSNYSRDVLIDTYVDPDNLLRVRDINGDRPFYHDGHTQEYYMRKHSSSVNRMLREWYMKYTDNTTMTLFDQEQDNICLAPQRVMNSYIDCDKYAEYQRGDFILHFADKQCKGELLNRYAALAS